LYAAEPGAGEIMAIMVMRSAQGNGSRPVSKGVAWRILGSAIRAYFVNAKSVPQIGEGYLMRDGFLLHSRLSIFFIFLCAIFFAASSAPAQEVTARRLEQADNEPQNWLTYYGNYRAWSYSALNQITRGNVKQLAPVWAFATGGQGGLEAAPLEADGVLYLENHQNRVFAVDAATGRPLWNYVYESKPQGQFTAGRGLAIGYGMIFMGTNDDHLVALDAKTGKEIWNVEVQDTTRCCGIRSAPLVVKDKVITGVTGGEIAHRGYLSAFDAKTGKMVWRFYTIPAPGEPGSETWPGDSWKTGGGSTWLTGSYDPELNLVYWGVGNPSSDFFGEKRQGSNLYTGSLIALDADTGKLKWHFQEIEHDLWDYDASAEPVLIDAEQNGQRRKLVLHSNKGGHAYLLDRETGKLLRVFQYVQAENWSGGLDENGKPVNPVIPEKGKDYLFCPGALGGRNFNHSAYSPNTKWWYTSDIEFCSHFRPEEMNPKEGEGFFGGKFDLSLSPTGKPNISAFDPLTGEKRWTFLTKYPNASSLLATAGDLIFAGDIEGYAFALDAKTGKKLWSFNTGGRISSPPISFSLNGRQYIAISTGGGGNIERFSPDIFPELKGHLPVDASTLFVFALPAAN
jgi:alcohol dehydrogenase (cytochrome c)